ncbi:MAG: leucine-rich repeat domain-containing protein [Spirochaetia bacterium]|nr:leucine-rich repeat domain-containing protein [Spirochaetia bacterium]
MAVSEIKRFLFIENWNNKLSFNEQCSIAESAFKDDTTAEHIEFNNISEIPKSAFESSNLKILEIGSNNKVKSENTNKTTSLIFKYISDLDGEGNSDGTASSISNSNGKNDITIQYRAFYNCAKLHTVIFPDIAARKKIDIRKDAFTGCTELRTVVFGTGAVKIDDEAFIGCNKVCFVCPQNSKAERFAREHGFDICNV